MPNYDVEEAGKASLLTPPEGRFSTPKGDIRIQTRQLTRLAEIKMGLVENFVISGCSSRPLTRPAFVGRDRILTLPARKYCVWYGGIRKRCLGALQVSC